MHSKMAFRHRPSLEKDSRFVPLSICKKVDHTHGPFSVKQKNGQGERERGKKTEREKKERERDRDREVEDTQPTDTCVYIYVYTCIPSVVILIVFYCCQICMHLDPWIQILMILYKT